MFKSVVPVNEEKHKNLKVKPNNSFDFAKEINVAAVMMHEFAKASTNYPIVFLQEGEEFKPVVLLGFDEGENLYIDGDKWNATYVPAVVRKYPFILATTNESDLYTICLDEDSDALNEEEGEALFNEDGTLSENMEKIKAFLTQLQQMTDVSSAFCKYLQEKELLTQLNVQVRVLDQMKNIAGAFVVNEEKLNTLSDEDFLDMKSKGYLAATYAHLVSISQITRLVNLKDAKGSVEQEAPKEETKSTPAPKKRKGRGKK